MNSLATFLFFFFFFPPPLLFKIQPVKANYSHNSNQTEKMVSLPKSGLQHYWKNGKY